MVRYGVCAGDNVANGGCPACSGMKYDPVCAINGQTYQNMCESTCRYTVVLCITYFPTGVPYLIDWKPDSWHQIYRQLISNKAMILAGINVSPHNSYGTNLGLTP